MDGRDIIEENPSVGVPDIIEMQVNSGVDMQKWEKELSETMEGLTLIEYSRGLKVPSIGEEKGEEGVGDNEGQKTSMAAMLKDIENEFASVEDLFK